ncbi:DUF6541 family protein [Archaeoglobus sp.]|uniref:DUF6541 family protein n=1 Tax=Archaeoglobus sp. TaxID=1872626 RepID=UPI0034404C80
MIEFLEILRLIFSIIIIFFIPGIFCVFILNKSIKNLNLFLIVVFGLSVSFVNLVGLYSYLLAIDFFISCSALFIVALIYVLLKLNKSNIKNILKKTIFQVYNTNTVVLLLIIFISLLIRYSIYVVNNQFIAPIGVDSSTHTFISKLILEKHVIPSNLLPYYPIKSFSYHFGFHSLVALFSWLSGLEITISVIIISLFLSICLLFILGTFITVITNNKVAALFGTMFAGWISIFPFYYLLWGRFTFILGISLLIIIITYILYFIKNDTNFTQKDVIILPLMYIGVFLSHYRATLALVLFLMLLCLILTIKHRKITKHVLVILSTGGTSLLVIFPWFLKVILTYGKNSLSLTPPEFYSLERIGYLKEMYSNYFIACNINTILVLLIFLITSLLVLAKYRDIFISVFLFWFAFLILFSNPYIFNLPFSGYLDTITVVSLSFYPLSLLFGILMKELFNIKSKSKILKKTKIILITIVVLNIVNLMPIVLKSQDYNYVFKDDLEAFKWIENNTKEDQVFLVNFYKSKYFDLLETTDAGAYIPIFTGRRVLPPPLIYGAEETDMDIVLNIKKIYDIYDKKSNSQFIKVLKELNIKYIYIGKRNTGILSKVDYDGKYFSVVYSENGVKILRLKERK